MRGGNQKHSPDLLQRLYRELLTARLVEEKMLLWLRKGGITKWFSGIGQEAITVGATLALEPQEFVMTVHRDLGVFTARGVPLDRLFSQFLGKTNGFSQGRERSFHFGIPQHGIVGMISHLAAQLAVADGIALGHALSKEQRIVLALTGEGATSEGDFHEALNLAAVWKLPVLFLIENNGYGLSTTTAEQYCCKQLSERGVGYGIDARTINGNDILAVYQTVKEVAEAMRSNPKPFLLECETFRMRGHEEASGVKYVPKELLQAWEKKDPISRFEQQLLKQKVLSAAEIVELKNEINAQIDRAIAAAEADPEIVASRSKEESEVFKSFVAPCVIASGEQKTMRFVDAISDGLKLAMQLHENLILMGQDIAEYGGVFKITEGFVEQFGKERVRNTPICESAVIGASVGLSLLDYKSVIEMQFADFVSSGFNQLVNNVAKLHWRWGQHVDTVIRMPTGAGVKAGPFHSQSTEAWFAHVPGLKIVYPAFPVDAKGLLLSAINDPNPVMYFEHKALYRSLQGEVPTAYYLTPIGEANIVTQGEEVTIITYGMGVHWALEYQKQHPEHSLHILDLRTLQPLDYRAIDVAVKKTGRVVVLHEATLFAGIGAEIASYIGEHLFGDLDAPVLRCASLDTPVPFAAVLEDAFLARARLGECIEKLIAY